MNAFNINDRDVQITMSSELLGELQRAVQNELYRLAPQDTGREIALNKIKEALAKHILCPTYFQHLIREGYQKFTYPEDEHIARLGKCDKCGSDQLVARGFKKGRSYLLFSVCENCGDAHSV